MYSLHGVLPCSSSINDIKCVIATYRAIVVIKSYCTAAHGRLAYHVRETLVALLNSNYGLLYLNR